MRRCRYLFPTLFLLIIAISWLLHTHSRPSGYVDRADWPEFGINGFFDASWQKGVEKYLARHLPALKYLLFLKNDIYEALNFGQFHAGYAGNIIQGKNGILFERAYLDCHFGYATQDQIRNLAGKAAAKFAVLRNLLATRHVRLLVILAPSKVDFFRDAAPWRYQMKSGEFLASAQIAPIYAAALSRDKVPFVDCYSPLALVGDRRMIFPDRGIHWSMYAAGLCLRQAARELNAQDASIFPQVEITGYHATDQSGFGENDLAELLNIWPHYKRGSKEFYLADFKKGGQQVPLILLGDSFMGQIGANMDLAGYANAEIITCFENRSPTRQEFMQALKNAKALLLIGNVTKYFQPHFESLAQKLIEYLEGEE